MDFLDQNHCDTVVMKTYLHAKQNASQNFCDATIYIFSVNTWFSQALKDCVRKAYAELWCCLSSRLLCAG